MFNSLPLVAQMPNRLDGSYLACCFEESMICCRYQYLLYFSIAWLRTTIAARAAIQIVVVLFMFLTLEVGHQPNPRRAEASKVRNINNHKVPTQPQHQVGHQDIRWVGCTTTTAIKNV